VREMCVSEDWEDRREEEKEGADTAPKTKTPHVNVGNKVHASISILFLILRLSSLH